MRWFKIFNRTDFINTGLYSRALELDLEGIGPVEILIVRGTATGIVIEDTFLRLNLNDRNPFSFGKYTLFLDANNDVFLGVAIED